MILLTVFGYQAAKGFWIKNQLAGKVEGFLPQINKMNQGNIRDQVVAEAQKLGIILLPDSVQISYEPTEEKTYPQRVVQKLATFENYRARIVVRSPIRVWGITLSDEPIDSSRINQDRAISRRQTELNEALKTADEPQRPPPAPASPNPPQSLQGKARSLQNRPELEQELNK